MKGTLLKTTSRAAMAAALAGAFATAAGAADLGGNCCTDLEERVAELEATTARKGTRKVSLTIYGQISQQVQFWDDGGERNVYVQENDDDKNRIGFRGSAKINSDWTAGFKLEYQAKTSGNQGDANQKASGDNSGSTSSAGNTASLSLRHAYWQLGSATYGTVSVGWQGVAAGGVASINLADPGGNATNDPGAWGGTFFMRGKGAAPGDAGLSALVWNDIDPRFGSGANGSSLTRRNSVKYSSPLFLGHSKSTGFRVESSWGEDDYWDVALKYIEEFGMFRFAAGIAYTQMNDNDSSGCANPGSGTVSANDCNIWTIGASLMHTPTGLYVSGAYAQLSDDQRRLAYSTGPFANNLTKTAAANGHVNDEESWWYIQAGWEAKLNALGKTTFWADYYSADVGTSVRSGGSNIRTVGGGDVLNSFGATTAIIQSADLTSWGLGVTQDIDAAAMKLFLGYKRLEGDFKISNGTEIRKANGVDDIQLFYTGATIRF